MKTRPPDTSTPEPPATRIAPPALRDSDPLALFETLKTYVGFTQEDSRELAGFFPHVEPHLDAIVEEFYHRILEDPGASSAITEGAEQVDRLKRALRRWLIHLLQGPHDEAFALAQARIGRMHVKVGLEQAYMIAGVEIFRDNLNRILAVAHPGQSPRAAAVESAVSRALAIVLALMLETYRETFLRKILETEKSATMRRLAVLGEVAASIAHEIRNPLAGISGAIQVLGQEMEEGDPRQRILAEVSMEIGRLDERVNDLLLYSRPSVPSREPTAPSDLLDTTRKLLAEDPLTRGVKLSFKAPGHLPPFPLDPGQIQQVLVNLLLNALQVMKGKGEIWVDARSPGAGSLQITVEDSGPGIHPDEIEKIFQPFFTTRPHGTGLGLSISRRIVEAHGGSLSAARGARGGARFLIHLPHPDA
jgi:signal transduction histidine kinase